MALHKCLFENGFFVESNKDKVIKVKKNFKNGEKIQSIYFKILKQD